ncbi:MAG: VCBS repeat-containing protein [Planctomycetota bacterium]|nr:VCBS repeat-containing protein [Planctomycetota bacterium]
MNEQKQRQPSQFFGLLEDRGVAWVILLVCLCVSNADAGVLGFDTQFTSSQTKLDGFQAATKVSLASDTTVTQITAYVNGGPQSQLIRYAIYEDDAGEPGAMIVESGTWSKGPGSTWLTIDIPDTVLMAGDYWLALSGNHIALKYYYNNGVGQTRHIDHDAIGNGFTNPWGVSNLSDTRQISIYATSSGLFTDVSVARGFNVITTSDATQGSGLHWADFDDDGDLDAIITGNSAKLLTNVGAGLSFNSSVFGTGLVSRQGGLLDLDNDGDIDFWHRDSRLYDNNGAGGFTDLGDLGFDESVEFSNEGVATGDVNGDGWADVCTFGVFGNWLALHDRTSSSGLIGSDDSSLGMNDASDAGDGEFISSGDVNNDGYPDFFYHFGAGRLFLSDADGTYTENAGGISVTTGDAARTGSAWGDYDNDGDLDLFVPRYAPGLQGWLWRNNNDGTFSNVAASAGLDDTSGQHSATWGDYDNDGDLDLYVVTHSGASNVLYQNQNNGTFVSVSENAEADGDGHDATFVDFDNDGDLDLAITQQGETNVLLENSTDDTNYLKVRVLGKGAWATNRGAIGVRVELFDSSGTTLLGRRDVGSARGYGGTEPLWLHFGGVNPGLDYVVRVHFLSGIAEVTVRPSLISTTIGASTIFQMLTVEENTSGLQILQWTEVDPMVP